MTEIFKIEMSFSSKQILGNVMERRTRCFKAKPSLYLSPLLIRVIMRGVERE